MTDLWDSEAAEYLDDESAEWDDEGEGLYFDEDDLFGEAKTAAQKQRDAARRRATVARKRALQMRQQAARRRTRPKTAAAAIRQTRADVSRSKLQNRVQTDAIGGAVKSLNTRSTGVERAISSEVLGDALNRELEKFRTDLGDGLTDALESIVEFVPLVFVRSPERGLRNPAVLAGLLGGVGALTSLIIERVRDNGEVKSGVDGNQLTAPRSGQSPTK
jgi:hypothetical protein